MQLFGEVECHGDGGDCRRGEAGEFEQRSQGQLIDRSWIVDSDVHVEHELLEEPTVKARPDGEAPSTVVGLCIDSRSGRDLIREAVGEIDLRRVVEGVAKASASKRHVVSTSFVARALSSSRTSSTCAPFSTQPSACVDEVIRARSRCSAASLRRRSSGVPDSRAR